MVDLQLVKRIRRDRMIRFKYLLQQIKNVTRTTDNNENIPVGVNRSTSSGFQFEETPSYIENGEMRAHQIDGLNWMILLYETGISGILAEEMGYITLS